jgi:hypothetical protein
MRLINPISSARSAETGFAVNMISFACVQPICAGSSTVVLPVG